MSDLQDLYQEMIIDHSARPRNYGPLPGADHEAKGHNPLCGDQLTLFLKFDGDRIGDIHFEGSGCAISKASSSVMTETVKGKSKADAQALFDQFRTLVTKGKGDTEAMGKLAVFSGVAAFPTRVKCAILAWHTLKKILDGKAETATTE